MSPLAPAQDTAVVSKLDSVYATQWHQENMTSPAYTASMKRYFENSKMMPHSPILSLKEGKISHYDHLFKKYSKDIGWDWRMLASLAYTESNFDTTAVSWAGAKGLMQLMPLGSGGCQLGAVFSYRPRRTLIETDGQADI